MAKKYRHLVKPLTPKAGPAGLYPRPLVWMEGKDLEGYNAHFCYTLIDEPCTLHPVQGAVVHPYDECLVFGGLDPADILYLGAEISIELGEGTDREEYIFNEPTVITVPRGVPHGPVRVRRVTKPFGHYIAGLDPEYRAAAVAVDEKTPRSLGTRYAHLVKKLITYPPDTTGEADQGFAMVMDERGVMLPAKRGVGPGNGDEVIWMYGKDLENFNVNLTWGHYSQCGKWHRGGEMHTHPEAEALIFVGRDPANPGYLGAELEFALGPEGERQIFNTPTAVICHGGFPHLPLITRWCDEPYIFMVVCLSGSHDSPWVEYKTED